MHYVIITFFFFFIYVPFQMSFDKKLFYGSKIMSAQISWNIEHAIENLFF